MIIGIIAAMDKEVKLIKESLTNYQKSVIAGVKFYKAQVGENVAVVVRGGVGKANISHATSLLCNIYKPDVVINTGIAGCLDPLKTSDVLIGNVLVYHDVDAQGFGYALGQVPGMPKYYLSDSRIVKDIERALKSLNINYYEGTILTGDSFITDRKMLNYIPANNDYFGIDMEGCAVAQICYLYQTPFASIRFISDSIDSPNQEAEYAKFEEEASNRSANICVDVLKHLH